MGLTPVHFFSHGSTMMLGGETESADYWKKCGDAALANGVKGVIMMHVHSPSEQGAHWDANGDRIEVATNPNPGKSPVAYVSPEKYVDYKLVPDIATGKRCVEILRAEGFNASEND
ncbi:hypothetical protein LTR28_009130, partial [Elasticomyces elasticus]